MRQSIFWTRSSIQSQTADRPVAMAASIIRGSIRVPPYSSILLNFFAKMKLMIKITRPNAATTRPTGVI